MCVRACVLACLCVSACTHIHFSVRTLVSVFVCECVCVYRCEHAIYIHRLFTSIHAHTLAHISACLCRCMYFTKSHKRTYLHIYTQSMGIMSAISHCELGLLINGNVNSLQVFLGQMAQRSARCRLQPHQKLPWRIFPALLLRPHCHCHCRNISLPTWRMGALHAP